MPKRMDDYVLNRVKYFENLQACGDSTILSRTLKRFRLEAIGGNKENEHPGKRHKATQTKLERMKSTRFEVRNAVAHFTVRTNWWEDLINENQEFCFFSFQPVCPTIP